VLRHYHYRVLAKNFGAIRLIEVPKAAPQGNSTANSVRDSQSDPAHPAAHGFVKGRSIRTFVAPHVGRRVVLKMDLQDFFPSLSGARFSILSHGGISRDGRGSVGRHLYERATA